MSRDVLQHPHISVLIIQMDRKMDLLHIRRIHHLVGLVRDGNFLGDGLRQQFHGCFRMYMRRMSIQEILKNWKKIFSQ